MALMELERLTNELEALIRLLRNEARVDENRHARWQLMSRMSEIIASIHRANKNGRV